MFHRETIGPFALDPVVPEWELRPGYPVSPETHPGFGCFVALLCPQRTTVRGHVRWNGRCTDPFHVGLLHVQTATSPVPPFERRRTNGSQPMERIDGVEWTTYGPETTLRDVEACTEGTKAGSRPRAPRVRLGGSVMAPYETHLRTTIRRWRPTVDCVGVDSTNRAYYSKAIHETTTSNTARSVGWCFRHSKRVDSADPGVPSHCRRLPLFSSSLPARVASRVPLPAPLVPFNFHHRRRSLPRRTAAVPSTHVHVHARPYSRARFHTSVRDSWLCEAPVLSRTALVHPRPPFDPNSSLVTWVHVGDPRGVGTKISMECGLRSISVGKRF